jgi:hypothetical protein
VKGSAREVWVSRAEGAENHVCKVSLAARANSEREIGDMCGRVRVGRAREEARERAIQRREVGGVVFAREVEGEGGEEGARSVAGFFGFFGVAGALMLFLHDG